MIPEVEVEDYARLRLAAAGDIGARIAEKITGKLPILESLADRPAVEASRTPVDMVFVVSGMESDTVARRTVELAALARQYPSCRYCVALLTESSVARSQKTAESMQELRQRVDALFLVSHQDLKPMHDDAARVMTELALEEFLAGCMIEDITRLLTERGLICIDFTDVREIMCAGSSDACLGIGIAGGEKAAARAAGKALARIREQGMEPARKGAFFVSIKGSTNLTMDDFDDASRVLHEGIHPDADIIIGLLIDDGMGANTRVMIMAKKDAVPVPCVVDERLRKFLSDASTE